VDEDGVAEAGADEQLVAELVTRPAQHVERVGILERVGQLIEAGEVDVRTHAPQFGINPE
jgi:hypothetical protein